MLMLLLKSFVCAVVTLGVIFGAVVLCEKLDEKLNDFGRICFCTIALVAIFTFCFFCIFADV